MVSLRHPLSALAQEEVVETARQVREVFLCHLLDLVLVLLSRVDLALSHRDRPVQQEANPLDCQALVLLLPLHSVFAIRLQA